MRAMREYYFPCSSYVFLLVFVFGNLIPVAGQVTWQPDAYMGVPESDRHTVVFDEFHDNRNNWNLESRYMRMHIEGGEFSCDNLRAEPISKVKDFVFDSNKDYQIEIRMRYVRGGKNTSLGLIFGADTKSNSFNFYYTPQGNYKITQYYNFRSTSLKNWIPHPSLASYAFNMLTVRKVGKNWFFFINKKLVHKSQALPLFGKAFGFLVSGNTSIEVDYFKIQELKMMDSERPTITLTAPTLNNNYISTHSNVLDVRGYLKDNTGIKEFTVNGKSVQFTRGGNFYTQLDISSFRQHKPIKLIAVDFSGNRSEKQFYVKNISAYNSTPIASSSSSNYSPSTYNTTTAFSSSSNEWMNPNGKNYILLIGVNQYDHWGNLNNAVKDCEDLAGVLTNYYQFEPEYVIRLFNKQATRENILETFESLQDIITPNDNLLIYYAGHGYYDAGSHLGYWVPVGARQEKIPDYIRNSTIHDYLKTIKSKHILLVADACYAGSLFATRSDILGENFKSRWAFTSGNIEKVWDGEPGQNSPFAAFLINTLRQNIRTKLPANDLIRQVSLKVSRNTRQTPVGSPLSLVGDEGGVFVFYRK